MKKWYFDSNIFRTLNWISAKFKHFSSQVLHKLDLFLLIFLEILKVIASLLKNSPQSPETMEVRKVFLSDMIKLFNNSRENRR